MSAVPEKKSQKASETGKSAICCPGFPDREWPVGEAIAGIVIGVLLLVVGGVVVFIFVIKPKFPGQRGEKHYEGLNA